MSEIPNEAVLAADHGITAGHERMANGELRFRLVGADGNGYVRTIAGRSGSWQNSHYHHQVRETYIVESGWLILAEWDEQRHEVLLTRYDAGEIVTTEIQRKHNVYIPATAVIHTVKHGAVSGEPDWHAAPELDALTKHLLENEVLARSRRSQLSIRPRERGNETDTRAGDCLDSCA